jgi:hypothetical protein
MRCSYAGNLWGYDKIMAAVQAASQQGLGAS